MHRLLALAAALAVLPPAPARADWQYTKWGMTPEEAVKASNGAMKLIPAKERKPVELTHTEPVAEGTYKDGALNVTVEFVIDTASGGLACVGYAATDMAQNAALKDWLVKRYGAPPSQMKGPPMDMWNWSKPDTIIFTASNSFAATVTQCKPGGPMG